MKVSEAKKILSKHKCHLVRQGSNHEIWISELTGKTFTIPRHGARELATGTWEQIKKDAGIE